MNIENINKAIAVMERAKEHDSVNMLFWQSTSDGYCNYNNASGSESELHACGNKACFAGHITVSPEWLMDPKNGADESGCPFRIVDQGYKKMGSDAIAQWFDVSPSLMVGFVNEFTVTDEGYTSDLSLKIYGVPFREVKAEHIIRELTLLRDLGQAEYCKLKDI